MEAFVRTEVNDLGVGTITFFHPASNSLPGAILRQLAEHITEAGERQDIRVIVMRSGGDRAFCAGASFDELVAISNEDEGLAFFSGFALVINHGIPSFLVDRVFEASRQFHGLPIETKMSLELNHLHRGYIPINTSTNVNSKFEKI